MNYWEDDEVRYSATEIRYAVNEVIGSVWGLWFWPFRNKRFWVQERLLKCLINMKPDGGPESIIETKGE